MAFGSGDPTRMPSVRVEQTALPDLDKQNRLLDVVGPGIHTAERRFVRD